MKKIELKQSIKQQDLILANAVSKMVDYIQDKWAAPYPSKEQTEAVNDYLRSVHANGDGTMNETAIVDFVDFVEDDSKKREKKIKDAVHNLFSFLEGKTLC